MFQDLTSDSHSEGCIGIRNSMYNSNMKSILEFNIFKCLGLYFEIKFLHAKSELHKTPIQDLLSGMGVVA